MPNQILQDLLTLSHELGREERGLAMLGEGNTSTRLGEETFLVKASGTCLGTLKEADVVECRLAALLPLDRLFGADFEDGSLDQILVSGLPASGIALVKAAAHWLVTGLPLLLAAAPLAVMLHLPEDALPALLAGLLAGTLLLSLLGMTGAAIVLGARRGGVLLPLLVLPLAIPALIFGVAAVDAVSGGQSARPHLLLLAALLAAALPLCPLAAGAALRSAAE